MVDLMGNLMTIQPAKHANPSVDVSLYQRKFKLILVSNWNVG